MDQSPGRPAQGADPGVPVGLAVLLRARREKLKLAQKKVAIVAGVSRGTLINLEKTVGAPQPETETVLAVAAALGLAIIGPAAFDQDPESQKIIAVIGSPDVCSRIVDVIALVHVDHPEVARRAAASYRTFIQAWTGEEPASVARALKSALEDMDRDLVPLLDKESTLDAAIIKFFSQWKREGFLRLAERSRVLPYGTDTPRVALQPMLLGDVAPEDVPVAQLESPYQDVDFAGYKRAQDQVEVLRERLYMLENELSRSRQELHEAQAAHEASMRQVAYAEARQVETEALRERLHEAQAMRAVFQQEVRELESRLQKAEEMRTAAEHERAELRNRMADFLDDPTDAARQFRRLKPEVQDLIRHGQVMDTTVVYSPDVPGLAHVILTVKPDDFPEHIGIRRISQAAVRMDLAVDLAGKILHNVMPLDGVASAEDMKRAVDEVLNFFGFDVPGLNEGEG